MNNYIPTNRYMIEAERKVILNEVEVINILHSSKQRGNDK